MRTTCSRTNFAGILIIATRIVLGIRLISRQEKYMRDCYHVLWRSFVAMYLIGGAVLMADRTRMISLLEIHISATVSCITLYKFWYRINGLWID